MEPSASACPSGIYAITHIASGKCYIGSTNNFRRRWSEHRAELNHGKHHSKPLQNAWRKYGSAAFAFTILEYVPDLTLLITREQYYLDTRLIAKGSREYNVLLDATSMLGLKHTPETRAKLSWLLKGRSITWSDKLRGRVVSEETRIKLSENAKKQARTPESNAKRSVTLKGRPKNARLTELARETRRRNILATQTPEARAKSMQTRHSRPPTEKQLAYWARLSIETTRRNRQGRRKPLRATQPFLWPDED